MLKAPFFRTAARRGGILLLALWVGGCESVPGKPAAQAPQAAPPARKLPAVELTPSLMYDVLLGEIAGQRGYGAVAAEALLRAATVSRDPRVIERTIRAALRAGDDLAVVQAGRLWVAAEPDSPAAHEVLGGLLLKTGDAQGAAQRLERALDLYGEDLARAYGRFAQVLGGLGLREPAWALMNRLVQLRPQAPEAYLRLAQLALRLRYPQRAQVASARALELRPGLEEAALIQLGLHSVGAQKQSLERFANQFLAAHPDARRFRIAYARHLLDRDDMRAARSQFEKVVELYPDAADAAFAAGLLALEQRDFGEAERFLRLNLVGRPRNDQARLYLGQIAVERRDYEQALQWYGAVQDPGFLFEAQLRAALALGRRGDADAALRRLKSIEPMDDQQRVRKVLTQEQVLREAKRLPEALAAMNDGVKRFPENTDLRYSRALLAAEMDLLELHEKDIRRVLAKEPRNAQALNALGYTLADQTARYDEALELLTQAVRLKPEDPFVLDSMGWVQYRLGNNTEAISYLSRAFDKRQDADIAAHLGEVLWVIGEESRARSIWRKALKDAPDSEVLRETIERFRK